MTKARGRALTWAEVVALEGLEDSGEYLRWRVPRSEVELHIGREGGARYRIIATNNDP